MKRGRIIYKDLAAGRLTISGLSKPELRALVRYCESHPEADADHEILATAMVEIVRRFMATKKKS